MGNQLNQHHLENGHYLMSVYICVHDAERFLWCK